MGNLDNTFTQEEGKRLEAAFGGVAAESVAESVDSGPVLDIWDHPWGDLPAGTAKTFSEDLAWAYDNAIRVLRRGSKGSVHFFWEGASCPPGTNGALTCLGWAASAPAKFLDMCKGLFSKAEQDEDEGEVVRREKKSIARLRRDVLEKLQEDAKHTPNAYFYAEDDRDGQ